MASLYVPCACLGVMQGPPLSATLAAAQQHPLDAQSLESALRNIHMIEESLKSVLPALHARRRSEEQPVPEAYDLDAELLAETEAEEARAERELISIRRRAEALGSLRHRRRFVTAGLEERASPVVSMQTVAAPQVGAADAAGIAPGVGSSEAAMVLAARASAAGEAAMAAAAMAAAMADRRPPTPPPLQRAPLQQPPLHLQQPPLQQPPLQQPPLQQPPLQQAPLQQPPLQQPQAQAQTKPAAQQPDSLSSPLEIASRRRGLLPPISPRPRPRPIHSSRRDGFLRQTTRDVVGPMWGLAAASLRPLPPTAVRPVLTAAGLAQPARNLPYSPARWRLCSSSPQCQRALRSIGPPTLQAIPRALPVDRTSCVHPSHGTPRRATRFSPTASSS